MGCLALESSLPLQLPPFLPDCSWEAASFHLKRFIRACKCVLAPHREDAARTRACFLLSNPPFPLDTIDDLFHVPPPPKTPRVQYDLSSRCLGRPQPSPVPIRRDPAVPRKAFHFCELDPNNVSGGVFFPSPVFLIQPIPGFFLLEL